KLAASPDIARHIAALMVLFSHQHALSGMHEPGIEGFETLGGLSVIVFFSISGFLIATSAMRSSDFISFMAKRVRRIFPALIACALVVNVFFGHIFNPQFTSFELLSSAVKTISLNGYSQSASSTDFIHSQLINGSLWTLPLEVACYLLVGIVLATGKNTNLFILILIATLFLSVYTLSYGVQLSVLSIPFMLFSTRALAFFIGCVMAMHVKKWNTTKIKLFLVSFLAIYSYSNQGSPINFIISCFVLCSVLTIIICTSINDKIISGRFDYSYGIYIYAFPVQQVVINKLQLPFYQGLILSAVIVIALAAASWHLVEKRFLRGKQKNDIPKCESAY
ncbi:acyltransferase family protein, partial [Citrobacter portucalensis]|uniref:acyltransferase family protein n=1 Tax=Citrobacter portucalensis TaxID=1639133 RepID=UPI00177C261D